jgi:hypothetical protein
MTRVGSQRHRKKKIRKRRNRSIVNLFMNDTTGLRNARHVTTFVKHGETRQTTELVRNANSTDFCFGQTRQSKCPCGMSSFRPKANRPSLRGPNYLEGSALYFVQPKYIHKHHRGHTLTAVTILLQSQLRTVTQSSND